MFSIKRLFLDTKNRTIDIKKNLILVFKKSGCFYIKYLDCCFLYQE